MDEPLGPEACGFCVTGNQALCYRHGPPEVREAGQRVRELAEALHGLASAPCIDCAGCLGDMGLGPPRGHTCG